jgi:hypothetical protein
MNAATGSYTVKEWKNLLALYDHCPMCLRRWEDIMPPASGSAIITVDHIIPIARGRAASMKRAGALWAKARTQS